MARLYSNENFPLPVVLRLRELGHDVTTLAESGMANRQFGDEEVLRFASADSRAVLTLNRRHFVNLHLKSQAHAGIIVCTVDADFLAQAERIHAAIGGASSLAGQLLRVNRPAR